MNTLDAGSYENRLKYKQRHTAASLASFLKKFNHQLDALTQSEYHQTHDHRYDCSNNGEG